MYRSVRDSGPVPVFPLTALVGRRESGKTSLLRALAGLDASRGRPFSLELDWPRGSRRSLGPEHVVCAATFQLAESETRVLGAEGPDAAPEGLWVGRTYGGALVVEAWNGQDEAGDPRSVEAPSSSDDRLRAFALEHLPRFLLAEHDSLLPGSVPGESLATPSRADEENGVAALARLIREQGQPPEELAFGLSARRIRECGEWLRADFRERGFVPGLVLDVDRGRVVVALERGGVHTPVDRLPRDELFRLTVELRLAAAALEAGRGAVLLLDGPGRVFRRAARARMRAMLETYVQSGTPVIYTARMPFQVELQHAEQVLVLAPEREGAMVDPREGPGPSEWSIRAALGMTGRSSFTVDDLNLVVEGTTDARVLGALDRLFEKSGKEGLPADLTLTSAQGAEEVAAVSAFLGRLGLGVIALFDSDGAGVIGNEHLRAAADEEPGIERLELLELGEAAGLDPGSAAIEDLFPRDYYMDAVRSVCGRASESLLGRAAKDQDGNPGARLSRIFQANGRRFPKSKVIEELAERLEAMSSVEELPEGMVGPVSRLMLAIRSAASRLRGPSDDDTPEGGG